MVQRVFHVLYVYTHIKRFIAIKIIFQVRFINTRKARVPSDSARDSGMHAAVVGRQAINARARPRQIDYLVAVET